MTAIGIYRTRKKLHKYSSFVKTRKELTFSAKNFQRLRVMGWNVSKLLKFWRKQNSRIILNYFPALCFLCWRKTGKCWISTCWITFVLPQNILKPKAKKILSTWRMPYTLNNSKKSFDFKRNTILTWREISYMVKFYSGRWTTASFGNWCKIYLKPLWTRKKWPICDFPSQIYFKPFRRSINKCKSNLMSSILWSSWAQAKSKS